jgi:hypothetical protein
MRDEMGVYLDVEEDGCVDGWMGNVGMWGRRREGA